MDVGGQSYGAWVKSPPRLSVQTKGSHGATDSGAGSLGEGHQRALNQEAETSPALYGPGNGSFLYLRARFPRGERQDVPNPPYLPEIGDQATPMACWSLVLGEEKHQW
jgi:hypothetical protein